MRNKIIVVNGKFYTGICAEQFSHERSRAKVIDSKQELKVIINGVYWSVMRDEIELKRIEVLDV
jgi:hypothetical protein